MALASSLFSQTTSTISHMVGPTARKVMSWTPVRAGIEDVGMFFGVGKNTVGVFGRTLKQSEYTYGLFNPRGWKGAGKTIRHGTWGARAGLAGKTLGRALGPAFVAWSAYAGYQEGGVTGAVKNVATDAAIGLTLMSGLSALGISSAAVATVAAPLAVGGAGIGAAYGALAAGQTKIEKSRLLEMGSPIVDPFGMGATMRQRSLQQLMFSQINGRSAFGSEAQLMAIPYMR